MCHAALHRLTYQHDYASMSEALPISLTLSGKAQRSRLTFSLVQRLWQKLRLV